VSGARAVRPRGGAANNRPLIAILGGVGTIATEALAWMLTENGNRVLGAYPNPRALQAALSSGSAEAQVVLIDADDPTSGVAAVAEVRRTYPNLTIVLLCEVMTPPILRCAIDERVEGVVLKSDSPAEVLLAFRHVLDGRAVMPAGWQAVSIDPDGGDPVESLSVREREVLQLAASGLHNGEIAERLMISANTVKFHLRHIYSRLGVRNRVQATRAIAPVHDDRPG
jgi:DNA-binding NarL/FixJ family response regulator